MAKKEASPPSGELAQPAEQLRDALGEEAHLKRRVDTLLRHFGFSDLTPDAEASIQDALEGVGVAVHPSLRDPGHGTVVSLSLNGNSKAQTTSTSETAH